MALTAPPILICWHFSAISCISFQIWLLMREAASVRLKIASIKPPHLGRKARSPRAGADDAESQRQIQNASGNDSSELILLCVMAKFLLSRLMPTALDVIEHLIGSDEFTQSAALTLVVDTSNFIVVVFSGANYLVFYSLSPSFRSTSTECCCMKRRTLQRELAGSRRRFQRTWSQFSRRGRPRRESFTYASAQTQDRSLVGRESPPVLPTSDKVQNEES